MTKEDKELLLRDLCARLPYVVYVVDVDENDNMISNAYYLFDIDIRYPFPKDCSRIKPYLRPMSSMTEEEKEEYTSYCFEQPFLQKDKTPNLGSVPMCIDWLNAHHFDYRGLIEKGLALEALKGMY